jgi:phosphopantothenoylcysteine decarboxylase/phosphopantothenate--cysteine ligase
MRPVLITAGATRNRIDAMRFISADSSGRTGAHIAEALGSEGLVFLGSPEACLRLPAGFQTATYSDTMDLMGRMEDWVRAHPTGLVVHAAAVGDYMLDFGDAQAQTKRPSGQAVLRLELVPTPKIVDQITRWSKDVFLVSFKAAPPGSTPQDLERMARSQQQRTRSQLVFANTIGRLGSEVLLIEGSTAHTHASRSSALEHLLRLLRTARAA